MDYSSFVYIPTLILLFTFVLYFKLMDGHRLDCEFVIDGTFLEHTVIEELDRILTSRIFNDLLTLLRSVVDDNTVLNFISLIQSHNEMLSFRHWRQRFRFPLTAIPA